MSNRTLLEFNHDVKFDHADVETLVWSQPPEAELMGGCATARCFHPATWRLEVDGVGSQYCTHCKMTIERQRVKTNLMTPQPELASILETWTTEEEATRIAELEAAVREIHTAAYAMSRGANGKVTTMCVPIGAWDNAMRVIKTG